MIARIARAALVAGALAGILAWAALQMRAVPIIVQAEVYENAATAAAETHAHGAADHAHAPSDASAEGWRRHAMTFLSTVIIGVGYGFLLVGAIVLSGRTVDVRQGMLWGLGGFISFAAAPALGLPPELPGMASADLGARQAWWLATAAASAGGLALIAFAPARWAKAAGAALLLLPHFVGAPKTPLESGALPAELAAEFAVVSLLVSAAFWVALGSLSGYLLAKSDAPAAES